MAELQASFKHNTDMSASFESIIKVTGEETTDYNRLTNLPKIYQVKLIGNKTLLELGLCSISNIELEELLK